MRAAWLMLVLGCAATTPLAARPVVWRFDNLKHIGGVTPKVEGHPQVIATPLGKAVAFNGVDDALFMPVHPLTGATTFTEEAVFRPDGGAFEQRWLHLAETDPKTGQDAGSGTDGDTHPRMLFEIRVVKDQWYLDAFVKSTTGQAVIAVPEKLHPIGPWYSVAQVYDGKMLKSYVNGELQGEAPLMKFTPHGPGHASIGVRINHLNYFHGAVLKARFTPSVLTPDQFLKVAVKP